ncbi:hypothetical protein N7486_002750 [Penicillium sp. IBT 16267x]|nr:hypothetical protein N7486_002750 [Penicillium sp. IBT 16267x]
MPRRAPPPSGYYEEDYFEPERERYPRTRRPERSSFEDDVRYRRRESMPLVEDMERMRVRERPPREIVRETFIVPPPDLEPPVRMRRSADDIGPIPNREEGYMRTRPRRSHRPRDIDPDELIDEREMRRTIRHRPRDLDEEYGYDERERRSTRRPRPEGEFEEEDIAIRRRGQVPQSPVHDSEIDRLPRERRYSDVRDEVYVRSSESRRKPHFRKVELEADIIDEREETPRRMKHRDGPSPTLSKEDERIMQWKDRPSPRELEEDEELRVRDIRRRSYRSPPRARYGRGPPGSWPDDREDEDVDVDNDIRSSRHSKSRRQADDDYELDARSKIRSRPDRGELEDGEEVDIHSSRRSNPRWEQTDYEELDIRSQRRPRREREYTDDEELDNRPPGLSKHGLGDIEVEEEIDIRSSRRSRPGRGDIVDDEVIDIRQDKLEREPRRRSAESDEHIIRKDRERSSPRERSPSPEPIRAPPIHQDVITHHRHIDHGFEEFRPPRAPSPEKASTHTSFDEIDMRHQIRSSGRQSEEDVSFKYESRDEEESVSPTSGRSTDFRNPWKRDERHSRPKPRSLGLEGDSSLAESPHSRSRRGVCRDLDDNEVRISEKMQASLLADDIPRNSVDEWSVVHAPSKDEAVEMTGALVDIVEVAPKGASIVDSESEVEVEVEQHGRARPKVQKERRDERWTEITKDLVVRDAIEQLGYEFEETRMFYYIFSYLEPADIDELVELSDHIRRTRRRRIKEMHRERASIPARSASLIDRMPPRVRPGGVRHIREREWIIDGHR